MADQPPAMLTARAVSIIAVLLLLVANALELLPVASPFEPYLSCRALVLGLVALVAILAGRGPERDPGCRRSSPDSYLLAAGRPALSDRHRRRGPRLGNCWDAQFMWIIDARKESYSGKPRSGCPKSIITIGAERREPRRWISSPWAYSRVPE
jgi:hypothetical protein